MAMGSASESEYQLMLARDLGYLSHDEYKMLENQLLEIKRMLNRFTIAVRKRI